jgi:DNA mismatch repair ATPase MutS
MVFYRDLFREAAAGVAATRRLLDAVELFLVDAFLADASGEISQVLEEMSDLLEDRHVEVARARRTGWRQRLHVLADDRTMRQDARPAIERLIRLVHELDALVSMADATRARGFVMPEIVDGAGEVQADRLYHPFLAEAVRNDLVLDERRRLLFLTGPNMAGKTTYLRACGIAVYLAHLGMGVPATAMRLSVFDGLYSAIGLNDNVREGISFFRAEALRVKDVARALAAGEHVLGILDEPFKGTNVRDALDASRAVLRRLARARGSAFLVASHLVELAGDLESLPEVVTRRFEAREDGRELRFDYVARPGVSEQRLGMRVLEEEGVFALLEDASNL